ncbi:MAG: cell envelope integrity protein CreD [Spirochaetaceae bacterium]|jgi:inner membrane protein|nr:cell envelope integrity protein CreD [Spirochaetaceae bacterium]
MASESSVAKVKKFTQGYTFKVVMLGVLVLLLLIPLNMIRELVRERSRTAQAAEKDIMEAWGAELSEGGPVVRIPGVRTVETRTKTESGGETVSITEYPFTLVVTPETLTVKADFKTEVRKRGIFSVPFFYGELTLSGDFDPSKAISRLAPNETLHLEGAELVVSLSSQKGIRKINTALWNGDDLFFQPGSRDLALTGEKNNTAGIYAAIPGLGFTTSPSAFDISISIQGGKSLRVLPIGKDTHVEVASDWASPSFQGAFLPAASTISDTDFSAVWDVSYLSRTIPLFWQQFADGTPSDIAASAFGVDFYRQIDTYSLNIRAVKYAIIFLVIPFLTLFLLEIFIKTRIHPVPYLLSGLGNIIFYLLLLSLSEQIPFFAAYLIAAVAVTAMLTLYARTLVTSWRHSFSVCFTVTVSYVLFYAVLNAESYALLIGSIGAFVIVALVMFLTRNLSWYGDEGTI